MITRKYVAIILIISGIFTGCSNEQRSRWDNQYRKVNGMADVGRFITIVNESGVTKEIVDGILKCRGWDDGDIWTVDQLNGDIRIIKDRNDGKIHIAAVEFWRWDPIKKLWYGLYTA